METTMVATMDACWAGLMDSLTVAMKVLSMAVYSVVDSAACSAGYWVALRGEMSVASMALD